MPVPPLRVIAFNTRPEAQRFWGGDTTQMMETSRNLQELGVCIESPPSFPPRLDGCDLVHLYNLQTPAAGLAALDICRKADKPVALSTIFWDFYPSVVSSHSLQFSSSATVRRLAGRLPKVARHLAAFRYRHRLRKSKPQQRELLLGADLLLPNSVAELEILVSEFKLPELRAKTVVVPNGVSPDAEQVLQASGIGAPAGLPASYVLQVASFHPVKGQARLIQALAKDSDIPLVFIGRSEDQPDYFAFCQRLADQRKNTYLLGPCTHAEIPSYYRHAKVHVLPSLRESPGLVSLEAAVYGANVVVSVHAPVQEYFGPDAFICDPENLPGLRNQVLKAWSHPGSGRLRERILQDFTWRKAAEATLAGYQSVFNNRSASP